jgi:hypothetical protein
MIQRNDMNIKVEVAKVTMSMLKPDILNIISSLDQLYTVAKLHDRTSRIDKTIVSNIPILPFEFVEIKKQSLPRKSKPSFIYKLKKESTSSNVL